MKHYLAPMEGITGYVYRNAHHKYYSGVDKYFTPFVTPNQNRSFNPREKRDVLPEHNEGLRVVPQILTNKAGDFVKAAEELRSMGYGEVNLNLGCPSKTVAAKGRGSGFLVHKELLEAFLDEIYTKLDMKISVKTRIGKDSPGEWEGLMELYNRFPMEELIIHPRLQLDYYKNKPNMDVFQKAFEDSKNRVCYNGDIFTVSDYRKLADSCPALELVMIGRGLIANPRLAGDVKGMASEDAGGAAGQGVMCKSREKDRLRAFHDEIYRGYQEYMSGERDVLFRMKELWFYLSFLFADSERYMKKIRKSERSADYQEAVDVLFRERELVDGPGFINR